MRMYAPMARIKNQRSSACISGQLEKREMLTNLDTAVLLQ